MSRRPLSPEMSFVSVGPNSKDQLACVCVCVCVCHISEACKLDLISTMDACWLCVQQTGKYLQNNKVYCSLSETVGLDKQQLEGCTDHHVLWMLLYPGLAILGWQSWAGKPCM